MVPGGGYDGLCRHERGLTGKRRIEEFFIKDLGVFYVSEMLVVNVKKSLLSCSSESPKCFLL